jgi:hypothetical protein
MKASRAINDAARPFVEDVQKIRIPQFQDIVTPTFFDDFPERVS